MATTRTTFTLEDSLAEQARQLDSVGVASQVRFGEWRKPGSGGVKFVAGHYCSGSSIAAAKIYADAGIIMISPSSTISARDP